MKESPYSFDSFKNFLSENFVLVLLALLITGVGFFGGSLWTENQLLRAGGSKTVLGATDPAAPAAAPVQATTGTASVDDDAVLGDKNAPVTIIEFSDYECPFCKRHYDETHVKLVEKYIDTGKAKLVFRDFPLSFHDPMATKEAIAANCAKEQGGDSGYYAFHDEIFKRTTSNGTGLDDAKIQTIASDLGLNIGAFTSCLSNPKMAEEVQKDLADGAAAGASGTPSFIIGKSTKDGVIEGDLVVGAQPLVTFETLIDALL
ncbi:MAG: thioredoxin domain-containing protein [Candidatus Pacebacteria bacterium]|nr:thioredoxin domain-containing protein [Candidatus Paceibacterota bacterium]PIR60949.1 MAG: disulfide bond formation protein DsbA [Candidatus Pacebacteria bacterium CG10_big_fil_rev_8_21_14_0_10_45_6]